MTFAEPIKNPCKGKCNLVNDLCQTCFRTRNERENWYNMDDEAKRATIRVTKLRRRHGENTIS